MKSHLIIAGLILAWLVTPESLGLLGRASGVAGILVILPLLFGVTLACFSAALIHDNRLVYEGKAGEFSLLSGVYGRTVAATILFSGRVPILLFASTGLLVSAGFAFNEIFLYWFPNFLFASLLLLLVCVINILDEKCALYGQLVFVSLAFIGILILIIMGVGMRGQLTEQVLLPTQGLTLTHFGLAFLLFLGFDFHQTKGEGFSPIFTTLILAFWLLVGWTVVASGYVVPAKLAESSISYLLVAREVGGEVGRFIMGGVIICGALSGVNGLFIVIHRTFAGISEENLIPKKKRGGWPTIILFTILIEVMMMTGFAGEEILETQIRASLLLWLLYLGLRNYAAGSFLEGMGASGKVRGSIIGGIILLIMVLLTVVDVQVGYIVKFHLISMIVFLIISFVLMRTYRGISLK